MPFLNIPVAMMTLLDSCLVPRLAALHMLVVPFHDTLSNTLFIPGQYQGSGQPESRRIRREHHEIGSYPPLYGCVGKI